MTRVSMAVLSAMLLCAAPATAQRFSAPGGAGVYPLEGMTFEVVASSHKGPDIFWCGASHYARRALDAPWNAQITVARSLDDGVASGRKNAVQFTLKPQDSGIELIRSASPGAFPVGDTYTVGEANSSCDTGIFRLP